MRGGNSRNGSRVHSATKTEDTGPRQMIMRHQMLNTETSTDTEFWSETYGGRSIAIFNHHGRWLAYLDQVLQKEIFATAEDAVAWLTQRIDRGMSPRLH